MRPRTKPRRLIRPPGLPACQTRQDYPHRPDAHPGTVAAYRAPAPPPPLPRRTRRVILRRLA